MYIANLPSLEVGPPRIGFLLFLYISRIGITSQPVTQSENRHATNEEGKLNIYYRGHFTSPVGARRSLLFVFRDLDDDFASKLVARRSELSLGLTDTVDAERIHGLDSDFE